MTALRWPVKPVRPLASNRGAGAVASQATSSLGNFYLVVLVAHTGGVKDVGGFAVAYALYTWVLGSWRATSLDPLLSLEASGVAVGTAAAAVVTRCAVASGCALAAAGAVFFLSPFARPWTSLMGVVLPFLLYLDAARYLAIARQRPWIAARIDAVWTGPFLVVGSVCVLAHASPRGIFGVWLACGGLAAIASFGEAGLAFRGFRDDVMRAIATIRRVTSVEYALGSGLSAVLYLWGGVAFAASDNAGLRVAVTVWSPTVLLLTAIGNYNLAKYAAAAEPNRAHLLRRLAQALGLAVAVGVGVTLTLSLTGLGNSLFGAAWQPALGGLLPAGLATLAGAMALPSIIEVRCGPRFLKARWVRVAVALPTVTAGASALWRHSFVGLLWTVAASGFLAALLYWRLARTAARAELTTT